MLSVIVPTYNERENVRPLVEGVIAALKGLSESAELLFIDDDSPDGTADEVRHVADELGVADGPVGSATAAGRLVVRAVVREDERDLAGAVQRGFKEARGDVIAVMDADLSHPPEVLPALLEAIRSGRADVAVASRRVKGGGVSNWPMKRRVMSWGAGLLARPLVPVKDTTSGFFALTRECVEGVRLRARGYKIGLEVLACGRYDLVEEVPYIFTDRRRGRSKLGGGVMLAYLVQLAALYRCRFPTLVRYLQFALVGAVGMLVDAAAFNVFFYYAGLGHLGQDAGFFLSQTASFLVAAVLNFVLNRAWTFREQGQRARLWMFVLVCAGGFLVRSVFGMALVGAGAVANVALLAGIAVASVWNFLASRRWAFAAGKGEPPPGPLPAAESLRPRIAMLILVISLTVVRLVYSGVVDLAADEAYYWQWSRHLDWGYHDHPPMVAYLIAAGTRLAGTNEVGVRLLGIALAAAATWVVYRMAAEHAGSETAGAWAAAMFALAPMFAAGAVIMTPDSPFIFFWILTVWRTQRALARKRLRDWVGVGIWLGLGMLSKYPMVLLPVALLAALPLMREGRRALRTPGPYVAALIGAVLCVPFLVWMMRHGWASVSFQLGHGLGPVAGGKTGGGGPGMFAELLGSQVAVVSPVLFVIVVWALLAGAWKTIRGAGGSAAPGPPDVAGNRGRAASEREATAALFVLPAAITFLVFGAASFLARAEANWPAAAYPTAFVLAGTLVARRMAAAGRGKKALAWTAVGIAAAMSLYVHVEAACPLFPWERGAFEKVRGRSELAQWAEEVLGTEGEEGRRARVCADDYQIASLLAFYLPGWPETYAPTERGSGSQYAAWDERVAADEPVWFFTAGGEPEGVLEGYREVSRHVERRDVLFGDACELGTITAYYGRLKTRE
jgi:dolichol-phosphate mannosyltransferase